ncbi:MAG: dTMP kinase [Myxococcota bacterium]|jgi:dTMP kinase
MTMSLNRARCVPACENSLLSKIPLQIKARYPSTREALVARENLDGGSVARGLLIVFEGLDGCGKSTQLGLLADLLVARQREVVRTKEPTDGPIGQRIRAMAQSNDRVTPEEELAWFMEDRAEHVREVIEPGIAAGAVVLSDRYWLSTVAYQGARGLDAAAIMQANEEQFPDPDIALIFEVSAAQGLERVNARGGVAEPAFEEVNFLTRAKQVFDGIARPYVARVDATGTPEEIHTRVVELVEPLLG